MKFSSKAILFGGLFTLAVGSASAFEVNTSAGDNANVGTAVFPIDFASTSTSPSSWYQFQTWNAPNGSGLKYFDISPYQLTVNQCIEISWYNTGNSANWIPDWIAYINTTSGWQIVADDNNLQVTSNPLATGQNLPAFRISGKGGSASSGSFVRISSYDNTAANNKGFAFLRIKHRFDLTQTQCETDGNWPVVRMGGGLPVRIR